MKTNTGPIFRRNKDECLLEWGEIRASLNLKNGIIFGHLGCKQLGTLRKVVPEGLANDWDADPEVGRTWRRTNNATEKLGNTSSHLSYHRDSSRRSNCRSRSRRRPR
ncbi:MAG: hypothetical protein ABL994_08910, partial [Verrucomicrobiales bacterium]